jgi:hypothetical protein
MQCCRAMSGWGPPGLTVATPSTIVALAATLARFLCSHMTATASFATAFALAVLAVCEARYC